MIQFPVPPAPELHPKVLSNFLGVDFTSVIPSERRASDMKNVINNNGFIETRPGTKQIGNTITVTGTPQKINGVWNIDRTNDSIMLVHAGTVLYSTTESFATYASLMTGLTNAVSSAFYLNGYLIILDGTRAIVYGNFGGTWGAHYLDTKGYIPTIAVGGNPDGTNVVSRQAPNLLSAGRIQTFLSDGLSSEYQLFETGLDATTPIITQLNSDGVWETVSAFTYIALTGKVTFTNPPSSSPVDGRDNIAIIYYKTNAEYTNHVNLATKGVLYGYEGSNNRLFITGEPEYKNVDWFSEANDPLYFPDDKFATIGSQPIVGYELLNNGKLAVLKNISDSDYTIYYRASYLYNGIETFPVEYGTRSVGTLSYFTSDNLLNDPLVLTTNGICGLVSNGKEDYSQQRSYYLNGNLQKEANLENAVATVLGDKYYLAINNHMYVLDGRYKSKIQDSTSNFQYDGYYWDDVPARMLFKYNNELYFGTETGKIVKFDNTICYDLANTSPIDCYFDTSYFDGGNITIAKTIKEIGVVCKPLTKTSYTLSYITDDEITKIVSKNYGIDDFPKTAMEKETIKNFNFVKFRVSNNNLNKMNFYQIGFKYIYSGKYRGE